MTKGHPVAKRKRPRPGSRWRVLAWAKKGERRIEVEDKGVFDELVVDDWLHIEQMDKRRWWMNVGGVTLWITVNNDGNADHVTVYGPGSYADAVYDCKYEISWPR